MTRATTPAQENLHLATSDGGGTNIEKYEFEPIKGFPMLNWRGKRPFTSTQYYPAQLREVHGEEVDGWRNKIFWGDNLQVMSHLLGNFRGRVDFAYLDPPFDSKANYKKRIQLRGRKLERQYGGFEEKQYSDIWVNDEYLQFMYERLVLLRELLKPNGIVALHCDLNQGHYLKLLMDEIYGKEGFVNQVVWKRSDAHNDTGQGAKHFGSVHDMILIYARGTSYVWNEIYLPLPQSTIDNWYRNVEEGTGRRYNKADMTGPGGEAKGNPVFQWNGITKAWRYSKERMKELEAHGRIVYSSSGMPYLKRYLDESKGVPLQDWWDDIQMVRGIQRRGEDHYPTEKPETLLERLIKVCSNSGDLVFDCFMGSGTTQSVAMKFERRFIGADINLGAVQTTTKRLIRVADELRLKPTETNSRCVIGFELYNVNHYDIFRNPVEAKELLIDALEVQRLEMKVFDGEKDGRMIKIMPVNRIATRADLNELIAGFDYKAWERRKNESPNRPVEKITLVCMGHEPDLAAQLELAAKPFKINVEVVDILRDKADLEFKRDSQAKLAIKKGELVIEKFYPMNLLQKLSLQKESVQDWKELAESVLIDWNYDGAVLQPAVVDIPAKDELVKGIYKVPPEAGTVRVKITDLLSESWEGSVVHG